MVTVFVEMEKTGGEAGIGGEIRLSVLDKLR